MNIYFERYEIKLKEALYYTFHYAEDAYKIEKTDDQKELLKVIGVENFINKCHEGYKIAQKIIIDQLIRLQNDLNKEQDNLNEISKGKHKKELQEDRKYRHQLNSMNDLRIVEASFRKITDSMIWMIFNMDRTKVKALMQKDMHSGSLQSSNISSLIKQVDEINKDNNQIAIICDITTFAGIGDLIIFDTKSKKVGIFECKEGKINSLIQEAVDQRNIDILKKHVEILPDTKSKKYFAKQVLRFFNQEKKMFDALNIMNKGEGFNHYFKKPSKSIEIDVKSENFSIFINRVLNEFYTLENEEVFIPFDCGELGILKGCGMARKWDFQHHIYHLNSKAVCPYLKHNPKENPNESLPHLFDYCRLPIFTLNELVFLSTHVPIYFLLSEKYVLDILAGRLTIATYFDCELFHQLCKKNKLEFKFKPTSECNSEDLQHLAVFNDKVIEISYKSKSILLTKGLLYRITYEFEFGEFVVKQIKELIIKIK